ncbi:trem-like transcript 4 protein isoform X1 [Rousettus aegyptiacus]|uniref:trem-like transcript 4 protein isoform X1 n=1 Tax=Rousettus aegyptiacus TaxID=9407 RepID=UPI00168CD9CD|nr:trem-like transcript 4 protein isoform X1 [Rousettus aegyptiacus]
MAREATYLLPLVLLVLLASGSGQQQLHKLEGETVSARCSYALQQRLKTKACCRLTPASVCTLLVTFPRPSRVPQNPRYFIQDYPEYGYFTFTITELQVKDSGFYACGIYESSRIFSHRTIHLVVSQASTPPTTKSAKRTTTWTSATSPVIDSPPGLWTIISSIIVALLLLLALTLLITLYLRKARRRAGTGKEESHDVYDISAHENKTAVHRKHPSPEQRESQLSWGSDQHMGTGKDTEDIRYASLTHLNHFSPEDSIYINTRSNLKPIPDPFLAVEYANIAKNRPQASKLAVLEEKPRM